MSVGDSGEDFFSIHALGRERVLVLSGSLPSHPLKILFSSVGRRWRVLSQFSTHQPPNVFLTEA